MSFLEELKAEEEYDKEGEHIFEHNGLLVKRDSKGRCWALSCRDYQGVIDESELTSVGKFKLVN